MRILYVCALTLPLFAGENAILSSGLRLHASHHETASGLVRLHTFLGSDRVAGERGGGF